MQENHECAVVRDLREKYGTNVISVYTRKQAIEDGVLTDLSRLFPNDTRIFKFPVACTMPVWERLKDHCDQHGNVAVWDLCYMSIRAKTKIISQSEHLFECSIPIDANPTEFKINVGPGDNYEPVITIMMPWED